MRALAFVLCMLLTEAPLGADQSPVAPTSPTQADLDKAVRELGNDQYKVREQASERLLEWTIADPELLKRLPTSDKDPEIANALEELPRKVQERNLKVRKEFYRGELMRLSGKDAKLREALRSLLDHTTRQIVQAVQKTVSQKEDKALTETLAEYLAEFVLTHSDPGLRLVAVWALGDLGEKSVALQISKHLEDADPCVRGATAKTLVRLGQKSFVPKIVKLLEDTDPRVRVAAAEALSQLNEKSVTLQIAKLLEDGSGYVREHTALALVNLGEKSIVPQIAKHLEDADPRVRAGAAMALGQLGEKSFVSKIVKLLEDTDPNVRGSATIALGQLGEKSVIPPIAKILEDPDPDVRQVAAKDLQTLSGETWPDDKLVDSARAWWAKHKDDPEFQPAGKAP